MKKFKLIFIYCILLVSCSKNSYTKSDPTTTVNELINKKCFHQALKAMPLALQYMENEQKEYPYKPKESSSLNYSKVFSIIATVGEKDWGKILDDPDIPYEQKTSLLFEIIKCRLGKKSINLYNSKNYILPINPPIVIQNEPINVIIVSEQEIFPKSWLKSPINAEAVPLKINEIDRSNKILKHALDKYPKNVLVENLEKIYVMYSLKFNGIYAGGTNSKKNVYLSNQGIKEGSTDLGFESIFHAEFSSILLQNFPEYLNKNTWLKISGEDFSYGANGVEAIKQNKSSLIPEVNLNSKGFLYEYAMSSFENDFNSIAKNIFLGENHFWDLVKKYPKLEKKTDLVIEFYSKLDPMFNKQYFQSIKCPETPIAK